MTNLQWMWHFFAEAPNGLRSEVEQFWKRVTERADEMVLSHQFEATTYFTSEYAGSINIQSRLLRKEFERWLPPNKKFSLILFCDEARSLCEKSAIDGKHMLDDSCYNEEGYRILREEEETKFQFSNF